MKHEVTIGIARLALAAVLLVPSVAAAAGGQIERILWNAIRFRQQAEKLGEFTKAAGIPLSSFDIRYDFQDFPRGYTLALTAGLQFGLTERDGVYFEVPYLVADWDHAGPRAGLGDSLIEYQRILLGGDPAEDSGSALLFALDLVVPTGSKSRGIGEGAWLAAPSLVGLYPLSERLLIAPSASYIHSFGPVRDRSSVPGSARAGFLSGPARQLRLSPNLVWTAGETGWILLSPDCGYDLHDNRATWELRAGFGFDLTESSGLSVQLVRHLAGPEYATRSVSILFTHTF